MLSQTFDLLDLPRVLFLAVLEIILSADNAIILALLVSHLPLLQRKRALFAGLISAFVFRAAGLLFVSVLLKSVWIQIVGAFYLFYLSYQGIKKRGSHSLEAKPHSFFMTILLIELFDIAFAADSILAGVAFINTLPSEGGLIHSKLWIVYVGTIIGLMMIRFAAKILSGLIELFPNLKKAAYLIIGWIGIKLALGPLSTFWEIPNAAGNIFEALYWIVLLGLFLSGFKKR